MISEEKMIHIVHLMLDGIWKGDMVDFPNEDEAVREAKKICLRFVSDMESMADAVRARIRSQRNAPLEGSPQWEHLYQKYYEEETRKRGG